MFQLGRFFVTGYSCVLLLLYLGCHAIDCRIAKDKREGKKCGSYFRLENVFRLFSIRWPGKIAEKEIRCKCLYLSWVLLLSVASGREINEFGGWLRLFVRIMDFTFSRGENRKIFGAPPPRFARIKPVNLFVGSAPTLYYTTWID